MRSTPDSVSKILKTIDLLNQGPKSRNELAELASISPQTAGRYLDALLTAKRIKPFLRQSGQRGRVWAWVHKEIS